MEIAQEAIDRQARLACKSLKITMSATDGIESNRQGG